MTRFPTRVAGIPCQVEVLSYSPGTNHPINSASLEPNDPEVFDWVLLDRKGYPAPWLEKKLTGADKRRIEREFHRIRNDERLDQLIP